jgi:hypothetical protein
MMISVFALGHIFSGLAREFPCPDKNGFRGAVFAYSYPRASRSMTLVATRARARHADFPRLFAWTIRKPVNGHAASVKSAAVRQTICLRHRFRLSHRACSVNTTGRQPLSPCFFGAKITRHKRWSTPGR